MQKVPNRVLEAYEKEHKVSKEVALKQFRELEKYLKICSSSKRRCAPSEQLDKAWHCFIEFTKEYREYCITNFGCFIDHDPTPKELNMEAYVFTRSQVEKEYGDPDPSIWPEGAVNAFVCGAKVINLPEFNAFSKAFVK